MRLGNDLCAVEICNDTRYTLNSADNPHYELDFEGNLRDSAVKNALRGMEAETSYLRILGNY